MRRLFIPVVLIVVAVLLFGGFNAVSNALDARRQAQAAQESADLVKSQEIMMSLPDWGKTLIITIGALYGMETFGPKLLLAAGMTTLVALVIVIILIIQFLTLITRPPSADAYKYSFYISCVISGLVVMAGGYMMTSIPGGQALFKSMIGIGAVVAFFAAGGGFGLRFHGGTFTSHTDEHGNNDTKAEGPSVAMSVSGRGRTSADSDVKFK